MTVVETWLEALRSGNYQQATGHLAMGHDEQDRPESFCCLGVACDLTPKDVLVVRECPADNGTAGWAFGYGGHTASLPEEARDLYGLAHSNGGFEVAAWETNPVLQRIIEWDEPRASAIDMRTLREHLRRWRDNKEGGLLSMSCLASLNDRGVPFDIIADLIESRPAGLFVEGPQS